MAEHTLSAQVGARVSLTGHFDVPVILEEARPLGVNGSAGFECRVRLPDGTLEEAVISPDEAAAILGVEETRTSQPADADRVRLLVESARIRLAYAYDRQFAVSLSGIRTLPHQIEAVYLKMLPQPRLRFLLADDPGAGKTIMAGLLIKELKLREALDRCLILVPAPLTIQWQDELLRFFNEPFQIIHSANDQQQLLNLWDRESQVVSSIDYAKQDDVRERVWQQRWDLIIIDEAHKCSAYTKRSAGREDEVERTKRYQLAERLSEQCDNLLLLTATPPHGDDDRFAHFIRLLERDLFPEPHRFGDASSRIRRDILKLGENCPWSLRRLKEDLDLDSGFLIAPAAIPDKPAAPSDETTGGDEGGGDSTQPGDGSNSGEGARPEDEPAHPDSLGGREIALSFTADKENVFQAWNAIANLADVAGEISIRATATTHEGYDKAKLENGVLEPLRELGLIDDDQGQE